MNNEVENNKCDIEYLTHNVKLSTFYFKRKNIFFLVLQF